MKNKKVISVILVGVALAVIVVLGVTAGRLVAGRQQELEQVQEESQTPPAQTATRIISLPGRANGNAESK